MSKSIHVNIENEETWNEFRAFVQNKHGKIHTVMGIELNRAIRLYLADQSKINSHPNGSAHTHERKAVNTNIPKEKETRPKSNLKSFEMVKDTFLTNTADTDAFQRAYAERLIKETMRVYDGRTIDKYAAELKEAWMFVSREQYNNAINRMG